MLESHLEEGAQAFKPGVDNPKHLRYGQSITDACLGWDDSLKALAILDEAVKNRLCLNTSKAVA